MKIYSLLMLLAFLFVSLGLMPQLSLAEGEKGIVQSYDTPEAKAGDSVVCPVMGGTFTVTKDSPSVTIQNKKYYVCCGGCVESLNKNPDKYLKGKTEPEAAHH
ncbi:MAG: TRASH domain-containing protein [Deltaproteobacteria bacterium]|nr:TRASH domain-containing protein [Deltaproteobacteria bacterium]